MSISLPCVVNHQQNCKKYHINTLNKKIPDFFIFLAACRIRSDPARSGRISGSLSDPVGSCQILSDPVGFWILPDHARSCQIWSDPVEISAWISSEIVLKFHHKLSDFIENNVKFRVLWPKSTNFFFLHKLYQHNYKRWMNEHTNPFRRDWTNWILENDGNKRKWERTRGNERE